MRNKLIAFIGLFLFLGIWISTLVVSARVRKLAKAQAETKWCEDLAGMCQVSLVGYFLGGAFLDLAYFDLPYNIMVLMLVCLAWIKRQGWTTERPLGIGRLLIPGQSLAAKEAAP